MNQPTNTTADTTDREIYFERLFSAPRQLVWRAWTEPEHVVQWWGPNGFTTTIHEMDVRPGGISRYVMHGPDGIDYPNKVVYSEVVKGERLVYAHGDDVEGQEASFRVTVTFADEGSATRLTMRMVFPSTAARDKTIREYGAIEGANQTLARLEQHLQTM